MKTTGKYILFGLFAIIFFSCKKAYNPNVVDSNLSYLVVEGGINSGGVDTTFIKLSRTTNIGSRASNKAELHASVKVESDQNTTFTLVEKGLGTYYLAPLSLNTAPKYRIHIKTSDSKDYVSDYVAVKSSPPIDSVSYKIKTEGLQINISTHDTKNSTLYYRWDYVETWLFRSENQSFFVSNGKQVVDRDMVNNQIYTCWGTANSNTILLGSTAKLSQDVIQAQLTLIDPTSIKIYSLYSILVKQYALTADEYAYWQNLKKNTETLGSIFDAQPSEIAGNIHCLTNPAEPVIGYIGVGKVEKTRIFVAKSQLPAPWRPVPKGCLIDTVWLLNPVTQVRQEDVLFNKPNPALIPISAFYDPFGIVGHYGSTPECVDCRATGNAVNKKPSFWP